MAIAELEEALKQRKQKKGIVEIIRYYIVPLLIVGIFLGVIFAGILPKYFNVKKIQENIEQEESSLATLQGKLQKLQDLQGDYSKVLEDLSTIEEAFPSGLTSVSGFSLDLEKKAKKYDLEQTKLVSGENIEDKKKEGEGQKSTLETNVIEVNNEGKATFLEIPAHLELSGNFNNFNEYLDLIHDDTIMIILSQASLDLGRTDEDLSKLKRSSNLVGGIDDNTKWNMKLDVKSYSFSDDAYRSETPSAVITNTDFDYLLEKIK